MCPNLEEELRRVMTMLIRVSRSRVIKRLMTKMTFLMFLDLAGRVPTEYVMYSVP